MTTLAIDPGPVRSGFVRLINGNLAEAGHYENEQVLAMIHFETIVLIEWLQCYGSKVGQSVLRTAFFCGQVRERARVTGCSYHEMTRPDVCRALAGATRGISDAVMRRASIDCFPATGGGAEPAIGTKKDRGPLYKMRGSTGHGWDALALFLAARKEGRI